MQKEIAQTKFHSNINIRNLFRAFSIYVKCVRGRFVKRIWFESRYITREFIFDEGISLMNLFEFNWCEVYILRYFLPIWFFGILDIW